MQIVEIQTIYHKHLSSVWLAFCTCTVGQKKKKKKSIRLRAIFFHLFSSGHSCVVRITSEANVRLSPFVSSYPTRSRSGREGARRNRKKIYQLCFVNAVLAFIPHVYSHETKHLPFQLRVDASDQSPQTVATVVTCYLATNDGNRRVTTIRRVILKRKGLDRRWTKRYGEKKILKKLQK